ncbi:MAG TPA: PAS domain-containing protein [Gammaproteobacteria bacterium]|nr:PAS domain-containing protein [Gammaproteobacteria bacterium]
MKNRITPTTVEHSLTHDSFIVSKTDTKGRITYANRTFMHISGYSEGELLGQQHNILRHPDMPRAVFQLLWDTIKQGRECFAFVKNLAKDGGFYWVFTNVTPDYDENHEVCGYFSVRRMPRREALDAIEPIYQEMLAAEKAAGTRDAIAAGTQVLLSRLQQGNIEYEPFILGLQG